MTDYQASIMFITAISMLVGLFIAIALYVTSSIFLMKFFKKAKVASWKAWVPVVNSYTLVQIGGQKGWKYLLGILVPIGCSVIVGIICIVVLLINYSSPSFTEYDIGITMLVSVIIYYVVLIAGGIYSFVIVCIAVYNINKKLGWGNGMVVLYIFLPIVWMGMAGLGKSVFDDTKGKPSIAKTISPDNDVSTKPQVQESVKTENPSL